MNKILDIFTKRQQKDNIFDDLRIRNYEKTPVFLFLFNLILVINLICYFVSYMAPFNTIVKDGMTMNFLFGSNQTFLILNHYQYWRIFTYPFFQNIFSWQDGIISFFFVFLTFRTIAFYFELFFKSKKTILFLLISIPIVGFLFVLFSPSDDIFLFGSEWICWLMIGGLLFLIFSKKESQQANSIIKRTILKISIILILILIYRYTSTKNVMEAPVYNTSINTKPDFFILFPIILVGIGFSVIHILHFDNFDNFFIKFTIFFISCILLLIFLFLLNYYFDIFNGAKWIKKNSLSNVSSNVITNLNKILNIKK